eukprot:SAG31_NODE_2128_length_6389_cov_2.933079_2_plen_157_part_00
MSACNALQPQWLLFHRALLFRLLSFGRCRCQITMKLKHPHIVNLLDIVFEEQFLYLIFELATDGALFDVVAAGKPLTEDEARFAFNQMCSAVQYCHEQNVVHRDLKLENIVMTNTPDGSFLKITDFGVSKDFGINSMPKTRGSLTCVSSVRHSLRY